MKPDMVVLTSFFCLVGIVSSTYVAVAAANITKAYGVHILTQVMGKLDTR